RPSLRNRGFQRGDGGVPGEASGAVQRKMMITPYLAEKLKSYVYAYVDPRDGEIFYVGKGVGDRAFAHLADRSESEKVARIAAIQAGGKTPRIEIISFGLDDNTASRIEAALIDTLPD